MSMYANSKHDSELFSFLKNPNEFYRANDGGIHKVRYICVSLTFPFIIGIIAHFLIKIFTNEINFNVVFSLNFFTLNPWLMVVVACCLEECTFRAFLRASRLGLFLTIYGIVVIATNVLLHSLGFNFQGDATLFVSIFVGHGLLLMVAFFKYDYVFLSAKKFISNNYKCLFWISCMMFSIAHIDNYDPQLKYIYLYLIVVTPQFVMGAILAFVRVAYGLITSIITHIIIDFMLISLSMTIHMHSIIFKAMIFIVFVVAFISGLIFGVAELLPGRAKRKRC